MCLMSSSTKLALKDLYMFCNIPPKIMRQCSTDFALFKVIHNYLLAIIFCKFSFDVIGCKFKRIKWNWIFCIQKETIILCLILHNIFIFFVCFTMAIWITMSNSRLLGMKDARKSHYDTPFNLYTFW